MSVVLLIENGQLPIQIRLGLSIAVAKINTEGNRVADVFYVTEVDGKKLDGEGRTSEVRAASIFGRCS